MFSTIAFKLIFWINAYMKVCVTSWFTSFIFFIPFMIKLTLALSIRKWYSSRTNISTTASIFITIIYYYSYLRLEAQYLSSKNCLWSFLVLYCLSKPLIKSLKLLHCLLLCLLLFTLLCLFLSNLINYINRTWHDTHNFKPSWIDL